MPLLIKKDLSLFDYSEVFDNVFEKYRNRDAFGPPVEGVKIVRVSFLIGRSSKRLLSVVANPDYFISSYKKKRPVEKQQNRSLLFAVRVSRQQPYSLTIKPLGGRPVDDGVPAIRAR